MKKDYTIGLDIGTNSVGYAVIYDDYKLVSKKMVVRGNTDIHSLKKNFWGVRLFDEGKTAQERRLKRIGRRRYTRRRNRLNYLMGWFEPEMNQLDANFFQRLDESFLVEEDSLNDKHPFFGSKEEEINYHKEYPTIYHLRKDLVDNPKKADLRLVYLAMAHIMKYRGHFLVEGSLNTKNISITNQWKEFIDSYNDCIQFHDTYESISVDIDFSKELTKKISKSIKVENCLKKLPREKSNGVFAQFLKLIVGNQGNFKNLFVVTEDVKLQINETYEESVEEILVTYGEEYREVFELAKTVYQAILFNDILTVKEATHAKISASMVKRYNDHKSDLLILKKFIRLNVPDKYDEIFKDKTKNGYAGYIDGSVKQQDFYGYLTKILTDIPGSEYFMDKLVIEDFLRKQRTFDNGAIPHQVHGEELQIIIDNQEKYYPFLKENGKKIVALFNFKIPYYVGPLTDTKSQFSWMIRKEEGEIRPWNFDEKVNKQESAVRFIERMTLNDTYISEKVLPKHSLVYEQFMVFNELTKVSYIDDQGITQRFTASEKNVIIEKLFKKERKITIEKMEKLIRNEWNIENPTVKGLDEAFNATYATYLDLKKIPELAKIIDDDTNKDLFEEIIKILTIFEDKKMVEEQLKKLEVAFDQRTIKSLVRKKYTGWGKLSRKLIDGIEEETTHKTILDYLKEDDKDGIALNRNFMQLISDESLSFKSTISKLQSERSLGSIETVVADLPGSPAIKKGIMQSLKIVEELVAIMGYNPAKIVIEMARETQSTSKGRGNSKPRLKKLEESLKDLGSSILKEYPTDNKKLQNDRLYLYYLQNGKDMYTGEKLEITQLSSYDIDHIIPRSFITDNSFDNLVLVSSAKNRGKSDDTPSIDIVREHKKMWNHLFRSNLISERKFNNLRKAENGGLTDADKAGFIHRQLVETRQITKHVAGILDRQFNQTQREKVELITLKSQLVSDFRKSFELYKLRELNDIHHAQDAYLNAVVGLTILKVYPQLKPEFVYGEYGKFNSFRENKATVKKQIYSNISEFFKKEHQITNSDGEVLWNKEEGIRQIRRTLNSHQVNVTKKVEEQKGKYSKESILQKSNSTTLIRRKNSWSTEKYGGFNSPVNAFSVIISHEKGKTKKLTKEFVGVTVQEKTEFSKNALKFLENKGFYHPKIIQVVPKFSLFELENKRRRLLSSSSESQKGNQFILPSNYINLLYHSKQMSNPLFSDSYNYVLNNRNQFEDLLEIILDFASTHILADKNSKLIQETFNKHKEGSIKEIGESFINLLTYTAMGAPAEFRFFDTKIDRKRYTTTTELLNATLIQQSITGLYETRIDLSKVE